jgi:hypothetical protein
MAWKSFGNSSYRFKNSGRMKRKEKSRNSPYFL